MFSNWTLLKCYSNNKANKMPFFILLTKPIIIIFQTY